METKEIKKIAKILFVNQGFSQSEIALRLNKSKTQINRWVLDGNWKLLKTANSVTLDQLKMQTYNQIEQIYKMVEEEGRILTPAESDQIYKLMAGIRTLDKEIDLATYIYVFNQFIDFLNIENKDVAEEVGEYQMEFLTTKAAQLSKD